MMDDENLLAMMSLKNALIQCFRLHVRDKRFTKQTIRHLFFCILTNSTRVHIY